MWRGEIWRTRIPASMGHVQAGDRPTVIIQSDGLVPSPFTLLVVPFTSNVATLRFPGTLLVQPDGTNGLAVPSVALVFQSRAVDRRQCLRKLGDLDGATLDQIAALLAAITQ